jgi:hypothetical protein
MPPRTRKVSPLRTGRYAAPSQTGVELHLRITHPLGSKAEGGCQQRVNGPLIVAHLQVYIEKVTAETLNRVVERYDVYPLAVLDIGASMEVANIAKLYTDIISCNYKVEGFNGDEEQDELANTNLC